LEYTATTAFQWAQDNAVAFDDAKSELLHFDWACQDTIDDDIKVRLPNGMVVAPSMQEGKTDIVRWIGMYLDRKLNFKPDVYNKVAAVQKTFNALC
jgi:hypothetical protein